MNEPNTNRQTVGKVSRSPWISLTILSCVGLIPMFANTMVLPAIPDFIKDLRISYNTSSWILASFLITGAVVTPIALLLVISKFIQIKVDQATSASISDTNTEFCSIFIHVRKDILLA